MEATVTAEPTQPEETATPTEEPADTPTPTPEPTKALKPQADASLSDDLYQFQVAINGDVYTLPMTFEKFVSYGWEYQGDGTQTLSPGYYLAAEVFEKDGLQIYADIINMGMNVEAMSDCIIAGLNMDKFMVDDNDVTITFAKGIEYGVSTIEDIKNAYGTPTDTYEGELYTKLTYELDSYQQVEFCVDAETKTLNEFEIENFTETEETASTSSEVSDEVPEIVSKYVVPTALGDDFGRCIVEYAGNLYQLPAPVSEFEKNGWTVIKDESDSVVKAKDFGWVTMMKDNQKLSVIANNYAENATNIHNCFVTSVEGDDNGTDLPITIQKNITRGMTQADLEKALTGTEYEKEDSTSFEYYTFSCGSGVLDKVEIVVRKDDKIVQKITVSNSPKTEELFTY
ncbi:MAG: hypothetical protein E7256_11855 [Lachnospiraceae bacterium]|nr:hypothetical protein [Lachnospiraceae bacterium]